MYTIAFFVRRFDENHRMIPASRFMVACGGHDQMVSEILVENLLKLHTTRKHRQSYRHADVTFVSPCCRCYVQLTPVRVHRL